MRHCIFVALSFDRYTDFLQITHRLLGFALAAFTISSIMIQSSCSNLKDFISPLTVLDTMLCGNVQSKMPNMDKEAKVLKGLFDAYLTGHEYHGNQYVWDTFNTFILLKEKIKINIPALHKYCTNEWLLSLLLTNVEKMKHKSKVYSAAKYKNKNLLNREIISIFKNVSELEIVCKEYPLSLEALLSVIVGTQITKVFVFLPYWLSQMKNLSSFDNITTKYRESNFNLEVVDHGNDKEERLFLTITYNI